ncbi:Cytoplasmic dynein 1 light intermediate chain 2, partial [Paragonimus heterotremus]
QEQTIHRWRAASIFHYFIFFTYRSSLLKEVQANASMRHSYGTSGSTLGPQLLILGSEQVGKTRLIARLSESTQIRTGVGLEFHYLCLSGEHQGEYLQLGVWCLDGDPEHSNLLKFALNEPNIWHTMVVVCLDLSEPWSMLNDLQLWLRLLQQHVVRLKLKDGERHKLRMSSKWFFVAINVYFEWEITQS